MFSLVSWVMKDIMEAPIKLKKIPQAEACIVSGHLFQGKISPKKACPIPSVRNTTIIPTAIPKATPCLVNQGK